MNVHIDRRGEGFPLIFFHGWGFDSQIWNPLLPQIECMYQVITVDLPGFGQSSVMEWEQFKYQLLKQIPKQFALLGWSMGGLYATRLALEEPTRVTQLINITSSPYFLMNKEWPGITKEVFSTFYKNLLKNSRASLKEFTQLQMSQSQLDFELNKPPSPEGLKLGLDILGTWDFREPLKHIKLPICYMFGRLDPIVSIKIMHVMQKQYPQFNYVFFNRAAHMPFLSHPDLFLTELKGFIK
jgi:pimeloyl-[acyl-carrier protein] methyl ester esterase